MITNDGKDVIMRYLAGYAGRIGDSISVGIGSAPEGLTSTGLEFELGSQAIQQVGVDMQARRLIFKVTLPAGVGGIIKEVSLWCGRSASSGPLNPAEVITLVDSATEEWSGGVWDTGSKINDSALRMEAAASSSIGAGPEVLTKDLSAFNARDDLVIAYEVIQNVSSLRVDLGTDPDNRYTAIIDSPPLGYNIGKISFGSFTKVGLPDWSNIGYLSAVVTATAAGPGIVKLDGIRVNPARPDGLMVSRKVLSQEIIKERNEPLDIEYSMPVSIT